MRQNEDVRTLVDREGFQKVESVVVIALRVRLVELDLDALVGAGRGEDFVERIACGDEIPRAQGSGTIRAGPDLDHHILGRCRRDDGTEQNAGEHCR